MLYKKKKGRLKKKTFTQTYRNGYLNDLVIRQMTQSPTS